MKTTLEALLFSLKPCYADMVFDGRKTAELRRRMTLSLENRDVFIYVSSPVRQLRGGFRVGHVWIGTPKEVWRHVSEFVQIKRHDFNAYYSGQAVAYALEITDVWEYKNPASLSLLGNRFQNFVVPQSWRYVREDEYRSFQKMKRLPKKLEHAALLSTVS